MEKKRRHWIIFEKIDNIKFVKWTLDHHSSIISWIPFYGLGFKAFRKIIAKCSGESIQTEFESFIRMIENAILQ
jgi:hypothetical protein